MSSDRAAEPRTDGNSTSAPSALDPDIEVRIGGQLRALYDEVVNEPIPERFLRLLHDLERRRTGNP
jgi:hypothetical protein